MAQLKSLQWWTGALFCSLLVLIVVFAYTARKPLCIDTKLVERIDSISDTGTATAYRCRLRRHVPFNEILAQRSAELGPRMQALEKYFEWLGPLNGRINLTVIEGKGEHFKIQGREVFISSSILQSPGQLEKAIFRVWFRERAPLTLQSQLLFEESFTDFLYYSYSGDFLVKDPKTGIYLSDDIEAKWPRVLSSYKGYCNSLWRSNEHLRFCNDDLIEKPKDEIELLTLRPLITQALIESYLEMPSSERLPFLQFMASNLDQFEFHEKNFGMSYFEPKRQQFYEAVSQLENWNYFLAKLGERSQGFQQFSVFFQNSLKRRGFNEESPKAELDTLVFADSLRKEQIEEIQEQMQAHPHSLIALEARGKIQMSAAGEELSLQLLGTVKAATGIYFHCGIPKLQELMNLSKRVEKLIFINACGHAQFKFEGLFNNGIESFAHQNPSVKFAEFHLPSLLLAVRKLNGQNPIEFLAHNKKESLAPIGWGVPQYDSAKDAFKAQSVIEIVNWYRL